MMASPKGSIKGPPLVTGVPTLLLSMTAGEWRKRREAMASWKMVAESPVLGPGRDKTQESESLSRFWNPKTGLAVRSGCLSRQCTIASNLRSSWCTVMARLLLFSPRPELAHGEAIGTVTSFPSMPPASNIPKMIEIPAPS